MTKIEAARDEYRNWCTAMGICDLNDLNKVLEEGRGIELINLCEARQERKYAGIANQIYFLRDHVRIVMISGPSSSGKTSSSLRIAQQCRVLGITPKVVEMDNYFRNREFTPRDEKGEYDFEALGAMDIELLDEHLNRLLNGEEVEIPKFDFAKGERTWTGNTMKLGDNDILFMEGIHALNPALTSAVDQHRIFRIYISALSALPGGEKVHNSTTDKRLLRRIVRDNRTRGTGPEETKNIFPFEENADVMFNSSTLYDLPLLKYFAEPLLESIKESSPAYGKASRLLEFLEAVKALKPKEIAAVPPTSIMREFIGGQTL